MSDPVRKKLDELRELRQENYITEEEYAAARENALLDAGFDIESRTGIGARFLHKERLRRGKTADVDASSSCCSSSLLSSAESSPCPRIP